MYLIVNRGLSTDLQAQLDSTGISIGVGVWVSASLIDDENALCARINDKTLLDLAPAITEVAQERVSNLEMMARLGRQDSGRVKMKEKLRGLYPLVTDIKLLEEIKALMRIIGLTADDTEVIDSVPKTRDNLMRVDIQSARDYILSMSKDKS